MRLKTKLKIERTFDAPATRVFDAFTTAEVMRRWWHVERHWETAEADVDLRVGGAVRVVMRNTDEGVLHGGGGEYTLIERPSRLAFTWVWDDEPHETMIEIEFDEVEGATTVRFTHSGLWSEETVRSHREGWNGCFDNLERELEAG